MENAKTVLLICSAGITTGLLVKNMKDAAKQRDLDIHIYSAPAITAEDVLKRDEIDALLIGPQSEYEITRLKDFLEFKRVPYRLIDRESYALLDGERVLGQALQLME
ncbi:MAG TPA: PTS sugar transporter subunit IIB [Facklamia tabacinasalis]|nr:PTS sugar transporter subunit IIB [Ruoffia tabacinasalis]